MKKKILILIPTLLLTIASCSGNPSSSSTSQHTHTHMYGDWTYVDENNHSRTCTVCSEETAGHVETAAHNWDAGEYSVVPTHFSSGVKIHKCNDCSGYYSEDVPALTDHVFDQEVITPTYYCSAATCTHGESYYKSCVCGEIGTEVFYAGNALGHNATSLTIATDASVKSYESGDVMDVSGLVLNMTCSRCNLTSVDISKVTFQYQNGNCFRVGDTKVTAVYCGASVDITGISVAKSEGYILNVHNLHIGCHEDISESLENINSPFGDVSLEIKDKNNVVVDPSDYNNLSAESSPYSLKASIVASSESKAYSVTKSIKVEHLHNNYDATQGYSTCSCGDIGLKNVYYDLSQGMIDTDCLIGSQKTLINKDTVIYDAESLTTPTYMPGQENLVIIDLGINKIKTKIFVASKVLNEDNFAESLLVPSDSNLSGYFVLGRNLNEVHTVSAGSWNSTTYFNATVDGRGHSISSLVIEHVYGLTFCARYGAYNPGDAAFKNLSITLNVGSNNSYCRMFGWSTTSLILDNVDFIAGTTLGSLPTITDEPGTETNGVSLLNGAQDTKNEIKNCTFNLGGYQVYTGFLTRNQIFNNTKLAPHTFENTTVSNYPANITAYWTTKNDAPIKEFDGLTYL